MLIPLCRRRPPLPPPLSVRHQTRQGHYPPPPARHPVQTGSLVQTGSPAVIVPTRQPRTQTALHPALWLPPLGLFRGRTSSQTDRQTYGRTDGVIGEPPDVGRRCRRDDEKAVQGRRLVVVTFSIRQKHGLAGWLFCCLDVCDKNGREKTRAHKNGAHQSGSMSRSRSLEHCVSVPDAAWFGQLPHPRADRPTPGDVGGRCLLDGKSHGGGVVCEWGRFRQQSSLSGNVPVLRRFSGEPRWSPEDRAEERPPLAASQALPDPSPLNPSAGSRPHPPAVALGRRWAGRFAVAPPGGGRAPSSPPQTSHVIDFLSTFFCAVGWGWASVEVFCRLSCRLARVWGGLCYPHETCSDLVRS